VKSIYIESILLIERLHRRFLDVVKTELDRLKINDINNVQTLILHNIGDEELTISELTIRGYYLGSNVSYNVKKLVESEYLLQMPSVHDKRSTKVKLSEKGLELCQKIDELYSRNVKDLDSLGVTQQVLVQTNDNLNKVERYWSDYMNTLYKHGYFSD